MSQNCLCLFGDKQTSKSHRTQDWFVLKCVPLVTNQSADLTNGRQCVWDTYYDGWRSIGIDRRAQDMEGEGGRIVWRPHSPSTSLIKEAAQTTIMVGIQWQGIRLTVFVLKTLLCKVSIGTLLDANPNEPPSLLCLSAQCIAQPVLTNNSLKWPPGDN